MGRYRVGEKPLVYFCGPIGDPARPVGERSYSQLSERVPKNRNAFTFGGYLAHNLRTIEALEQRGFKIRPLRYAVPELKGIGKVLTYAAAFQRLAFSVLACKPNSVFHLTGLRGVFIYPEFVLILLAKFKRCFTVYDIHAGGDQEVYDRGSVAYRLFIRAAFRTADLLLVEGQQQTPFVESVCGRTPVFIPSHVTVPDGEFAREEPDLSVKLVITYAGHIRPEKDIATILEAAKLLRQKGIDVEVRLAGAGSAEYIDDLKARYPDSSNIWLGLLGTDRILELFTSTHFFLFPTRHKGEGQSNALTESMACGCVPIASDRGFNAATIGDCGRILGNNASASDYSAAVWEIWTTGQWWELSRRCRERILNHYSTDVVVDRLANEYSAVIAGSASMKAG